MWVTVTVQRRGSELCDEAWVYEMADRSPAPAASLLYEGATHFHGGSPAAFVGPYIRTEIADWLPDRAGARTASPPGPGSPAPGVAVLGEGHRRRTWFPPPHGWAPYRLTTPHVITHGRRRHTVSLSTRAGGRDGRRACGAWSATRRARRTCRPTVSKWSAGTCWTPRRCPPPPRGVRAVIVCVHTLSPQPGRRAGQDFVDVEADGVGSIVAACRANSSRLYSTSPRS